MSKMKRINFRERLDAVRKADWNQTLFKEWYGCDIWSNHFFIGGQFRTWAKRALKRNDIMSANSVDRFAFEQYLRSQQWTTVQFAANHLALTVEDFQNVLQAMIDSSLIIPRPEVLPGIYPDDFLQKLPKQLPSFRNMVYGSENSYVKEFHRAVKNDLNLTPELQSCSVCKALGYEQIAGTVRDILTFEPVGIQYSVWLDFGKPISLRPDECSELTFSKHANDLVDFRMGKKDPIIEEKLQSIVAESTD